MDENILRKIKKCLELGKSTVNESEAANAIRHAQNLMRKHGISHADVNISNVDTRRCPLSNIRIVKHHASLINLVQFAFGVKAVLTKSIRRGSVTFVGISPQPELAGYCYEVLWTRLKKARTAHVKSQPNQCKPATKTARGDRFAEGWVSGVYQQVLEFAVNENEASCIESYMDKHFPALTTSKPMVRGKKANTKDSIYAGYEAGRKQSIHHSVTATERTRLTSN